MKLTGRPVRVPIDGSDIHMRRTTGGVVEIRGADDVELARGTGFAHAHDRMAQMMLVRLAGQGRLAECLKGDDEMLAIDVFMRQMDFASAARADVDRCGRIGRELLRAYCAGVNEYLRRFGPPLALRLVGYRPEPWAPQDSLLTVHLMSYVGLAQSQQDMEKFLIQAVRSGVSVRRLKRLFSPHLDGLDEATAALIRDVRICEPLLSPAVPFAPAFTASNNWAVSASRSASGRALQCNDPHLEVNRLPCVWYELVMHTPDDYRVGVSVPGLPGLVMGRTRSISYGFTYGFMDMVDYFIEDCRDGRVRREEGYQPLRARREVIRRKKGPPVEITVFESDRGVLETDPHCGAVPDGLHLCRAYSGRHGGAARSLEALAELPRAASVAEARAPAGRVAMSCNWVIADRHGGIGYQQSGLLPVRKHSGLYPVPAWDESRAWKGVVPPGELSWLQDPADGILATANDDRNQDGKPLSINLCMGPYRVGRIVELLRGKRLHTLDDMKRMQGDLFSIQARRFLAVLRPLIPDTPSGRLLAEWDLCYDTASRGATLFESFYEQLLREVFGRGLFGLEAWDAVASSTCLLAEYFHYFDDALLGEDESWFGREGREAVFRRIVTEVARRDPATVKTWGETRQIMMGNMLFGGRLPRWLSRLLGVDYGPVALPGNRATISQGAVFRSHGRATTFAPSYRYVTDLGEDEVHTAIPGGPSGRVLSKWYTSDVARWLDGRYKTLRARPPTP